jgi:hypothetical protein
MGVNFWDPIENPLVSVKELFGDKGGYVLLLTNQGPYQERYGKLKSDLDSMRSVGLTPIIRYDYEPGNAAPICQDDNELACQEWKQNFVSLIAQINGAPESLLPLDSLEGIGESIPFEQVKARVFIVGNEPNLDGELTPAQYATTYAILWKAVHIDKDDPKFEEIELLVAGASVRNPQTISWIEEVSNEILNNGANVDGYAIHTYGYGIDAPDPDTPGNENCQQGDQPDQPCDLLPDEVWAGDDGFLNYKDQLNVIPANLVDKPVYITEFNTNIAGGLQHTLDDIPNVPAENYPLGWIIEAANVIADEIAIDDRIKGIVWFVGTPNAPNEVSNENWRYFALTEPHGLLPCAREDFKYVTRISDSPSEEGCREEASAPSGGAALVWSTHNCIAQPDRTFVWGRDDESGLDHVTVVASPADTHDLSWTQPGRTYSAIFEAVPPVGGYATFTLYDRAGNLTQRRVFNPGSFRVPGCDHPDENESAAGAALPPAGEWTAMPAGTRAKAQVAVFNGGFAGNLIQLLWEVGEPAALVERDFDPVATAEQYPVLIIPSGGLYGLENSLFFKKRLELYAEAGGTIVVFAQQHGYEFNVLPGAGERGSGGAGMISLLLPSPSAPLLGIGRLDATLKSAVA